MEQGKEEAMIRSCIVCLFLIASIALLVTGCGGTSSPEGDGDVGTDDVSTPDEVQQDQPGDVPSEEAPNETQDPAEDRTDGQEDPPEDAAEDLPAEEIGPDAADVVDEDAPARCLPLRGTIVDVYSWTLDWMGSGTNATFTLNLSNLNSDTVVTCNFSDIEAVEAVLTRASDGSTIITYQTVGPDGAMDTTLGPGESSATDFTARYPISTVDDCDTDVIIELSIEYMIDGVAAAPIQITSGATNHNCVE
jgi:hypothetical protein